MKTLDIIKEEASKAFPTVEEAVVEAIVALVFEKIAPRLALEAEETAFKVIGAGIGMIYPTVKPALDKITDFNHDGK